MEQLIQQLHILLGNYFVFYTKLHQFHWNIEGNNFPQYHDFFGILYNEIWLEVDNIAEKIRQCGYYVSANPIDLCNWADMKPSQVKLDLNQMLLDIISADLIIQENLNLCNNYATDINNQGLMNYFAGRLEYHQKLNWQVRSCL